MTLDDALLAALIFGGHAASGLFALALLLPRFRLVPQRHLLALALLITPAGLAYLHLFGLAFSGNFLAAMVPAALSIGLLTLFLSATRHASDAAPRSAPLAVLAAIPIGWGNTFTLIFAHSCFLGACA